MSVLRFTRNTRGRDLVVGDIHGHFTRLRAALASIGFDPDKGDRLFSVGDMVDRGPESNEVEHWLSLPWFHAVQGNHEDMAIRWPDGNMSAMVYAMNGGGWNVGNPDAECRAIADLLGSLPIAIEIETEFGVVGLVHANVPHSDWGAFTADLAKEGTSRGFIRGVREVAMWDRSRIESRDHRGVVGVYAVVVGHTPVESVTTLGNVVHIDTGGWFADGRGYFTLLDISMLIVPEPAPHLEHDWDD